MDWEKSLCAAILAGAALLTAAGCGAKVTTLPAATAAPAAVQVPSSPVQRSPLPASEANGNIPVPPSGNLTGERPAAPALDLAAAAAKLGVTEQQLTAALGNLQPGIPDLAAAAQKLGVTETALREALGIPNSGAAPGGLPPASPAPTGQ
jgi:hypothetical protein